jgi:hypothetical protein
MSTGALITHGVSGFPCLGVPGDFDEQRRGEPWQVIVNDPIRNYLNAQNHIGVPVSNFNEFWTGGVLQEGNFDAAPYRVPVFSEPFVGPPGPSPRTETIARMSYPSQIGAAFPSQLPVSRIAVDVPLPLLSSQNLTFESGTGNGDNKVFMPHSYVNLEPNKVNFQGATTAAGVHPNNDKSGATTAPNTSRADFTGGQAPYQKLPNGASIGSMQPGDQPQLWEMAPPPDPPVIPQEGMAPLAPTTPAWW